MQFVLVLRELWGRKLLVAVGLILAAIAGTLSVYQLSGTSLKPRQLQYSSAYTMAFVDTIPSSLGNINENLALTEARAALYANLMTSPQVLDLIGQAAGIPGDQLYAAGPVDQLQPRSVQEPTAIKRNVELTGETVPYRLNFNNDPNLPNVSIYAQAPTTPQAVALANASVVGLQEYITQLENQTNVRPSERISVRELGRASGGVVNAGISKKLVGMVFVSVFVLWSVLVLVGIRVRATWRASAGIYLSRTAQLAVQVPGWSRNGSGIGAHAADVEGGRAVAISSSAHTLTAHRVGPMAHSTGVGGDEAPGISDAAAVGS